MIKRFVLVVSVCLTALLISSCSDGGTKSGIANLEKLSAFESYVDKYPDLVAAYNKSGSNQTKSAWGETHYCNNGRTEGRTYTGLSAARARNITRDQAGQLTSASSSNLRSQI